MSSITKQALEHALKSLLLKKPFHKITINDITEECGVSRMTFYYHFKDIYDLVSGPALRMPPAHWREKRAMTPGRRGF